LEWTQTHRSTTNKRSNNPLSDSCIHLLAFPRQSSRNRNLKFKHAKLASPQKGIKSKTAEINLLGMKNISVRKKMHLTYSWNICNAQIPNFLKIELYQFKSVRNKPCAGRTLISSWSGCFETVRSVASAWNTSVQSGVECRSASD
jgi:hypothetical protein